jgi:hypothetical protein
VSSVKLRRHAALTLPAASVAVIVMVWLPSAAAIGGQARW